MKTFRSFTSAQQRQVDEAVRITSTKAEIMVMNRKKEWHQAPIVRVVGDTGLHGDHRDDQAQTLAYGGGGRRPGRGKRGVGHGGEGGELRTSADQFNSFVVPNNHLSSVV